MPEENPGKTSGLRVSELLKRIRKVIKKSEKYFVEICLLLNFHFNFYRLFSFIVN